LWTRVDLARHAAELGLAPGDSVLVHAGLRSVGPILGGPDSLIDALLDVIGPAGTILAYCDWNYDDRDLPDPALRPQVPPFDPARSLEAAIPPAMAASGVVRATTSPCSAPVTSRMHTKVPRRPSAMRGRAHRSADT
jgi:aminoglycoside N3'-acetyltransferase